MAYATFNDCERYLEEFGTQYYGTLIGGTSLSVATLSWQNDINAAFDRINVMLDTVDRVPIVPVGTNVKTGSYHPTLIEWNAVETIFTKLKARHAHEFANGYPDWILHFGTRSWQIYEDILAGRVALDTDTTNRGIGYPIAVAKIGVATFHSNWDSGFYNDSEYPRTYRIKVSGTASGNNPGQAVFQVSEDDGYSWLSDELETGTSWIGIAHGLDIRWEVAGTLLGTQKQIELGDTWKITCIPINVYSVSSKAQVKRFRRG